MYIIIRMCVYIFVCIVYVEYTKFHIVLFCQKNMGCFIFCGFFVCTTNIDNIWWRYIILLKIVRESESESDERL